MKFTCIWIKEFLWQGLWDEATIDAIIASSAKSLRVSKVDDRLLIRTIRKALKSMANSAMEAYRIRCSWHGDLAKEAKRGNKRSKASKRGPTSTRKKTGPDRSKLGLSNFSAQRQVLQIQGER